MTDRFPDAELGEAVCIIWQTEVKCDEAAGIGKGKFVTLTDGYTSYPFTGHEADSGERVFGVALEAIAENEQGKVLVIGIIKMNYGGPLASMDPVKTDDSGDPLKALAADDGLSAGYCLIKGAQNDQGLIFVMPDIHGIGV